jgi:hypothetical protein
MSPTIVSLFTESSDPLGLHLHAEHQRRDEQIKAWREAQSDPYFSEVPPQWRREFQDGRRQTADSRRQQTLDCRRQKYERLRRLLCCRLPSAVCRLLPTNP